MNPFTRTLLEQLKDRRLVEFVVHWDSLEALVIRVYKEKTASEADEREYSDLRLWLQKKFPGWQAHFQPYWQKARIAGELARQDPFTDLLAVPRAGGFIHNRRAMQTLPAARQALNEFLVDRIEQKKG